MSILAQDVNSTSSAVVEPASHQFQSSAGPDLSWAQNDDREANLLDLAAGFLLVQPEDEETDHVAVEETDHLDGGEINDLAAMYIGLVLLFGGIGSGCMFWTSRAKQVHSILPHDASSHPLECSYCYASSQESGETDNQRRKTRKQRRVMKSRYPVEDLVNDCSDDEMPRDRHQSRLLKWLT